MWEATSFGTESTTPTRRAAACVPPAPLPRRRVSSSPSEKMLSAYSCTSRPVSDSTSPRPARTNRGSPIAPSSSLIWPLIVCGVTCSTSEARTTLPSRATVWKYSRWA